MMVYVSHRIYKWTTFLFTPSFDLPCFNGIISGTPSRMAISNVICERQRFPGPVRSLLS